MKQAGQIVLTPSPHTDLSGAKLRPVLMLRRASRFDDWLVCMVSSKLDQADIGFDEIIATTDSNFATSGLKAPSVLRLSRLAVLDDSLLAGSIGSLSTERLERIRQRLSQWPSLRVESCHPASTDLREIVVRPRILAALRGNAEVSLPSLMAYQSTRSASKAFDVKWASAASFPANS